MADKGKKIELTEEELNAEVERRVKDASLTDDEKKIRSIVADAVKEAVGGLFDFDDDADDDGDGADREQRPRGAGKRSGLTDAFLGRSAK